MHAAGDEPIDCNCALAAIVIALPAVTTDNAPKEMLRSTGLFCIPTAIRTDSERAGDEDREG